MSESPDFQPGEVWQDVRDKWRTYRDLTAADQWRECPEHGPFCVGDNCCCADKHSATAALPALRAEGEDELMKTLAPAVGSLHAIRALHTKGWMAVDAGGGQDVCMTCRPEEGWPCRTVLEVDRVIA